jgi:hypothetical protein
MKLLYKIIIKQIENEDNKKTYPQYISISYKRGKSVKGVTNPIEITKETNQKSKYVFKNEIITFKSNLKLKPFKTNEYIHKYFEITVNEVSLFF